MSKFMDAVIDLLPEHNSLKSESNELRKVLNNTVGAWFDNRNIQDMYDGIFITTATGRWLDLFGKDYNVARQEGENDEDYKIRIIQDAWEHLTPTFLDVIFNVQVYVNVNNFNPDENMLTSDNYYINGYGYMATADNMVKEKITNKFVLGEDFQWF